MNHQLPKQDSTINMKTTLNIKHKIKTWVTALEWSKEAKKHNHHASPILQDIDA